MESLNRTAAGLLEEAVDFADELAIGVRELENGATVLDFGIERRGGIEAGLLMAEVQTAGLASVATRLERVAGVPLPHLELATDHPGLALLGAQKAGWELSVGDFEGLGSGPARALVAEEAEFDQLDHEERADVAVLAIESERLPGPAVAEHVADRAGVDPAGVVLATFRSASVVGSVTMAARAAELAVFRLFELGGDPTALLSASAVAPVAPVAGDETAAIGRTNDALAYGGVVHLQAPEAIGPAGELPSSATADYGRPFVEIFEEADWDFYAVPESVFAPAMVVVEVVGDATSTHGAVNEDLLAESFELAG